MEKERRVCPVNVTSSVNFAVTRKPVAQCLDVRSSCSLKSSRVCVRIVQGVGWPPMQPREQSKGCQMSPVCFPSSSFEPFLTDIRRNLFNGGDFGDPGDQDGVESRGQGQVVVKNRNQSRSLEERQRLPGLPAQSTAFHGSLGSGYYIGEFNYAS